jgi:hypothetical protein
VDSSSGAERSPMPLQGAPSSSSSSSASSSHPMSGYSPYSGSGGSGSGQPVISSMMRDLDQHPGPVCSRDQEPAPLLSSKYETLSDDDDNWKPITLIWI